MPRNAHEDERDWDSEACPVNARMKLAKASVRFHMEKGMLQRAVLSRHKPMWVRGIRKRMEYQSPCVQSQGAEGIYL